LDIYKLLKYKNKKKEGLEACFLAYELDELGHSAGEAPLVIVPSQHFDEVAS
jgi:hypothetical protein